ncbi:hypothetical protein Acr_04g0004100 [Actinidia rufa]|uniref:Uncharacterized protein n=1 Tax=Actinidia rufa TaxID=165716 RepID=A0A7J0EHC2_9ERIC|nr:hypothetical protein Acr_04g0004100 [Actinidia rufa]
MHLRSRCLPRLRYNSPLDNRTHPLANTSQVLDLEGLHREIHGMAEQMRLMNENNVRLIQLLVAANLPPPIAPPILDAERSHRSRRSGDHSQNHSTDREQRDQHRSPSLVPPRRERSLSSSESRIRQKNASHLFTIHQKEIERLKNYVKRFYQAILEVEDPSDKVVIMAMMEGLQSGPLFDSLSKNVHKTLSAFQNKVDKYIAAEELADAKRRRRGKDDPKRKEPDNKRSEYRGEARNKRSNRDSK